MDSICRERLENLNLIGKVIANSNVITGRELISAVQLGAGKGYGFDVSPKFIQKARILGECH
jgi:hypothetical protein